MTLEERAELRRLAEAALASDAGWQHRIAVHPQAVLELLDERDRLAEEAPQLKAYCGACDAGLGELCADNCTGPEVDKRKCPRCKGTGRVSGWPGGSVPCVECGGSGVVPQ